MRFARLPARLCLAILVSLMVFGCASSGGALRPSADPPRADARTGDDAEIGLASYYAHRFDGRRTAYGERYDEDDLTAAHPTLPAGTMVRVTNLENGRKVVLRINDRGPWKKDRVIDVSYAAARKLGFVRDGIARVRVEVVER
ncbi:MAG: septal ring lytic transglycosylase RlpA family protein [Hyphomicrobiales bacterium]